MRTHVISRLIEKARQDDRIVLLVGDLGYNVVEEFQKEFPQRFINCGIAEQNMMSVAAGMALEGDKVFVYSIGNFPTLRCLEQIRNDVCYHNADVNIISVGGGFSYGSLGMSHHTTEELAILRSLPEMKVYAPADYYEANAVLDDVCKNNGPSYMRLARGRDSVFYSNPIFSIDTIIPYREYNDENYEVTIISTGTILEEAINAERLLEEKGVSTRVFSCPSIKPLDTNGILRLFETSKIVVSLEEHNYIGGLGSAIAETISSNRAHAPLLRIGLNDIYSSQVGSTEYLRKYYLLDGENVCNRIIKELEQL